ncbi:hypothetical protein JV173_00220 [Acholeplasma equirhinis]|uniref:MbeB family mobilization protein n=1 Tax=Acholeplasma equirhinis TaxID=555393 RepID=UPI00197A8D4B|nr:MbeB family mobilization protein [Acholeplasma equirhinis]MBN3489927.1 hypothetical protein [Acholeplasma equirhinis]
MIDHTKKDEIIVGLNLTDSIVNGLSSVPNNFGIDLIGKTIDTIFDNTYKHLSGSINPFLEKSSVHTAISNFDQLFGYYREMQTQLVKILILGRPANSRVLQKSSDQQLKYLEDKLNKNITQIDKISSLANEFEDKLKTTIESLEEKRKNGISKIDNDISVKSKDYKKIINDTLLQIDNIKTDFRTEKESLIKTISIELDEYKNKVEEIVGLINGSAQAGVYKQTADKYQVGKWIWQILSIVFILSTATIGVLSIFNNDLIGIPNDWIQLILRIFITLTLGSASAYCARLAHKNF